jgi:hypothetical protein
MKVYDESELPSSRMSVDAAMRAGDWGWRGVLEFQAAVRAFWMRLRKNAGNLDVCSFIREFILKHVLHL